MQKQPLSLICLALFLFAPQLISSGWTQTDPFYKGKTIRIMVGSTAGGFYDRWARLFARYMGRVYSGSAGDHRAEHAGRRIRNRHQPCLQRRQA